MILGTLVSDRILTLNHLQEIFHPSVRFSTTPAVNPIPSAE
jgi:hypothetical protein